MGPKLPMVTLAAPPSISARRLEYVYICASAQMPTGVLKVGETHRQSPEQRARQFTGMDKLVTWDVVRALNSPDSKYTERLVHARLNALGVRYLDHREMFCIDVPTLVRIIEESIAATPTPTLRTIAHSSKVAVPNEVGPWRDALSMPLMYNGSSDMTLARAMALASDGDVRLQRKLAELGIRLVYPDEETPHFLMYSLSNSKWGVWLKSQGLEWGTLSIPEGGQSRKVKCVIQNGR